MLFVSILCVPNAYLAYEAIGAGARILSQLLA